MIHLIWYMTALSIQLEKIWLSFSELSAVVCSRYLKLNECCNKLHKKLKISIFENECELIVYSRLDSSRWKMRNHWVNIRKGSHNKSSWFRNFIHMLCAQTENPSNGFERLEVKSIESSVKLAISFRNVWKTSLTESPRENKITNSCLLLRSITMAEVKLKRAKKWLQRFRNKGS